MHKGKVVAEKDEYNVIDCEECGFMHLDPIPSDREIETFYQKRYYQDGVPKLLTPEREESDAKWSTLDHEDVLSIINKNIAGDSRRILDVGCGNGYFLSYMQNHGWNVMGIEPSESASKYAESMGLNVFKGSLEKFIEVKWNDHFDVINLKYVLEHVPNPRNILSACKSVLKDAGLIMLEVPNDFNKLQLKLVDLGKPEWWISIPDHINYFSFTSLETLLNDSGFELIWKMTRFPMEMFLMMGDDYVANDQVGRFCHQKRMLFDLALPIQLRREMYQSLSELGIGRSCIICARQVK